MLEVTLKIELALTGPVLTQATAMGALDVDSPMARLTDSNKFFLPFSLVQGRLRQSWEELQSLTGGPFSDHLKDLLGQGTGDADVDSASDFSPMRGRLCITDFVNNQVSDSPPVRFRIRMDSVRGAAVKGSFQTLETPFAPDEQVSFTGSISYLASDEEHLSAKRAIEKGLRWITSLGAERTSGFGRLLAVNIAENARQVNLMPAINGTEGKSDLIGIRVSPDAPFCVSRRRVHANLFESEDVLPGAVLKGSLATTLKLILNWNREIDGSIPDPWRELGRNFDRIRFTHACPAPKDTASRPVEPPRSLVKDMNQHDKSEGKFYDVGVFDVATCSTPGLLGSSPDLHAPIFSIDWKSSDDVRTEFGWDYPRRELRVRTQIDRGTRRAKDQQLFAFDTIVPTGHHWYGYVDLSRITQGDRALVEAQLRELLGFGLWSIGKTNTRAAVAWNTHFQPKQPSDMNPLPPGNQWVITLQTPALLCDPTQLEEISGSAQLYSAYQRDWQDLSGGKLRLVRFFAQQSLAGGYLVRRFQPGKSYNPFLLTDSGSVFVLEAASPGDVEFARNLIEQWYRHGLPLPTWAKNFYGDDWRTCPFRPTSGFGEIAVNLTAHTSKKPPEAIWHAVH